MVSSMLPAARARSCTDEPPRFQGFQVRSGYFRCSKATKDVVRDVGNEYLDFSRHLRTTLGHCHPKIVEAADLRWEADEHDDFTTEIKFACLRSSRRSPGDFGGFQFTTADDSGLAGLRTCRARTGKHEYQSLRGFPWQELTPSDWLG